ncbi:MAG: alpha/beta hydrolase [Dermatophilus congolensis]|nr:alpha/beta hydrolase [Dermatophilus congolensis]
MGVRPRLVLVHGTRFDSAEWAGYAERLPQCEVVTVDLPGHGSRVGESFDLTGALRVIDEAVTAPAPEGEQPVVLAGHSLGGYLSAEYARRHPERLAGLGIIGAAADPSRHRHLTHLYSGFAALLPVVGADRMARFANSVMGRAGVASGVMPGPEGYAVTADAWSTVIATSGTHQLRELTCPVLVISGQWDQLRIDAARYAAASPGGWVVTVPRATHLFPLTHPEALATALAELVRRST